MADPETNSQRIDLRVPKAWVDRVEEAAKRKGLGLSAYIRMVVLERLDADGITGPTGPGEKKKSK